MKNRLIQITQGEQAASKDPEVAISTLLGSCVAVCLWEPMAKVGGMNHILLTRHRAMPDQNDQAGIHAMETLINAVMKLGGKRTRLLAKVFGGAQMVPGLSVIGTTNAQFTINYLRCERILVVGQSLGGRDARQVMFSPTTGAARVRTLAIQHAPETNLKKGQGLGGAVELF